MKHVIYHKGRAFQVDGEIPFTHVLMGQRDQATDYKVIQDRIWERLKPANPPEGEDEPAHVASEVKKAIGSGRVTDEERIAIAEHTFNSTRGWFAFKVLAWGRSEAEAEELRAQFPSPEWINLEVREVNVAVPHA